VLIGCRETGIEQTGPGTQERGMNMSMSIFNELKESLQGASVA